MEFSFDRSKETHLRDTAQPQESKAPNQPQQTHTPHTDGIDTSTIANERLRKAIEKNRARQAERARMSAAQSPTQPQPQQTEAQEQASLFDKQQQHPQEEHSGSPPRPRAQERTQSMPKSSTVVTRRSAARPDEAEFTPVKRTTRKVASQISYTTTARKKAKPVNPKLIEYLVKGCWGFCAIMVLRLIFAKGGVTDFYSQRSLYNNRLEELSSIKKENMSLVHEIERMQTDSAFQKKLVRDNLGFIASDEYLVLFPKEK